MLSYVVGMVTFVGENHMQRAITILIEDTQTAIVAIMVTIILYFG